MARDSETVEATPECEEDRVHVASGREPTQPGVLREPLPTPELRFFTPSARPRLMSAMECIRHAAHAVDRFHVAHPGPTGEHRVEWIVVRIAEGTLHALPAGYRPRLPRPVQLDLANQELLRPPWSMSVDGFHLFSIDEVDTTADLPGVDDPVQLRGTLHGPFPSENPVATSGELTATRAGLLEGLLLGAPDPFDLAGRSAAGASQSRCHHLVLPAAPADVISRGRGVILAVPSPGQAELLGELGNVRAVKQVAHAILAAIQADSSSSQSGGPLDSAELPMADRFVHVAELELRGFRVAGNLAYRSPLPGFLGRFFGERVRIPPEGTVADYLHLADRALACMPGWPTERALALGARLHRSRASWSADGPFGVRPLAGRRDGEFQVRAGVIRSPGAARKRPRCVYFEVDEGRGLSRAGDFLLDVEVRDVAGGVGVDYDGPRKSRSAGWQRLQRTKEWTRLTFEMPAARFRGGHAGGDFRIVHDCRAGLEIGRVLLRRVSERRTRSLATEERGSAARRDDDDRPERRRRPGRRHETRRDDRSRGGLEVETCVEFGFRARDWKAVHDVCVQVDGGALVLECTGDDPHVHGPPIAVAAPAVAHLRLRSSASGDGEVLWTSRRHPRWDTHPARFPIVHDGEWHDYTVPIGELGVLTRLRLDPGMGPGRVAVAWLRLEHVRPPLHEGDVSASDRVAFFDPRYPSTWLLSAGGRLAGRLEERGVETLDATHLAAWMRRRIDSGAPGSVCFMAHDVAPDTVLETPWPECTARRYLERGGRIVWVGDAPFAQRGLSDGSRIHVGGHQRDKALGLNGHAADLPESAELTDHGRRWGLRVAGREGRQCVRTADVTAAFSTVGRHHACAWFKNYDPRHPASGLVRLAACGFEGTDDEAVGELVRVGLHGLDVG